MAASVEYLILTYTTSEAAGRGKNWDTPRNFFNQSDSEEIFFLASYFLCVYGEVHAFVAPEFDSKIPGSGSGPKGPWFETSSGQLVFPLKLGN